MGEGDSVAVAAGEDTSEALEAVGPLPTIKAPLKAMRVATLATTQGPHKTNTIRMGVSMELCLSNLDPQTHTITTIRASGVMKVRVKSHRTFKLSGNSCAFREGSVTKASVHFRP